MTTPNEQMFATAFDEALQQRFAAARHEFLRHRGDRYFSDETDATLTAKLAIVRDRMSHGRSLSEVCDDPDVYLGRQDREYISRCLNYPGFGATHPDLDSFRRIQAYREASDYIRRACFDIVNA